MGVEVKLVELAELESTSLVDVVVVLIVVGDSNILKDVDETEDTERLGVSSSGQMPDIQGLLEQHPRNFPTVQTYQSLLPVQVSSAISQIIYREE
ncbi:hypothetical protein N7495_006008 [Penicillium taxi]|uniref:uncharacterized protein n=1 Tax=Penicillium taxi TaxID=168475 RepID=UPI002544DFFB|nr:uncharacterized protein N7495_006008 [Penicillium taxi]KAJ5894317.1 hypothetical protein N7495_006008 [Penicillium taxi]